MFVDNLRMTEDDQVTADRFFQVRTLGGRGLALGYLWEGHSLSPALGLTPEDSAALMCAGPQGHQTRGTLQIFRTLVPTGPSPSSYTTCNMQVTVT